MNERFFASERKQWLGGLGVLSLVLLMSGPLLAAPQKVLHGHVPTEVSKAKALERVHPTKKMDLAIALPLRNGQALDALLSEIYDPASPRYRKYLTPEEFAAQFGPSEEDYQRVIAFANAHGLTVSGTHGNRTLVDVSGTATAVEQAFRVKMNVYKHPTEGRNFFAPENEPSVELPLPVLSINGLDDFALPRPIALRKNFTKNPPAKAYVAGSGPRGYYLGNDFRKAYAPGVELTGAGQTVGLFELDMYYPGDVAAYQNLAGLPNVPITTVLLNGFTGNPGLQNVEVALDIDMAIAMAPGLARVIVYAGKVPNDVLNRMATDNQAKQLSCSWGFGNSVDPARQQIFKQFAAQGQSFLQAAGDLGAYPGAVPSPSDDPFVTCVGGTVLTTGPTGAWASESGWQFGGGGYSGSYTMPSWQRGISMVANRGSTTMRNVPDVACIADEIWIVADNGLHGVIGGTSAAAPLWAGYMALVNQQAQAAGQPSVGFINPALYALGQGSSYASLFHDVVTGNNTNSSSRTNYFAVPGYDLCAGLGTPGGSNLINALLAPAGALRISPQSALVFAGPQGGPFSPSQQTYVLTNDSNAALNWNLFSTASWLQLSTLSGALAPGGPSTSVPVTLASGAQVLPVGSYSGTIWFTNLTDGFAQSRQVQLEVVAPVTITSQPSSQSVFEGADATFVVGTSVNASLSYQWRYDNGTTGPTNLVDGPHFSGTTSSTLLVSSVTPQQFGAYSVIVSNASGAVTSSSALLTITPSKPVIVAQPIDQNALPAQTVILTVKAVGSQPISYQWRKDGGGLSDTLRFSGTQSSKLTISNVSEADAGGYSVVLTNPQGTVPSGTATLTIGSVTAPNIVIERLYSFQGDAAGANPNGLMQHSSGNFYGTALNGGANGFGTVFRMNSAGTMTPLYSFTGQNDGADPLAALTEGIDNNLYGTTYQGGANDNGTIFQMTPQGAFSTLQAFTGTNGALPLSKLLIGTDASFYGTSYQGGIFGRGTVFRLTAFNAFSSLYSFSNGFDGGNIAGSLSQDKDGTWFGTAYKGGAFAKGTVFKMSTNGLLTTLISFNGTNGSFPSAGLTAATDGSFYGVTSLGGASSNGTLFKITSSGQLTSLGKGTYGFGTIFRLTPTGALTILGQFDGYNGANPQAALVQGSDGRIYGTTPNGGVSGQGVIFRFSVVSGPEITAQPMDQTVYTGANVTLSAAVSGTAPLLYQWQQNGANISDGGNVFGTTNRVLTLTNVTAANAAFYSLLVSNSAGWVSSDVAYLDVISSPPFFVSQPVSQTVPPGTNITLSALAQGDLPLSYRWLRNGTNFSDSENVFGSTSSTLNFVKVTEANNGSYSVTVSNHLSSITSSNAVLTVIPASATGTRLTTLYNFSSDAGGRGPNGLTLGSNGLLYGTTQFGPSNRFGSAFSFSPSALFTMVATFGSPNGSIPKASLVPGNDGNLYGTTRSGGALDGGTVFKMSVAGAITTLHSFTGESDGAYPQAALIQATDGSFYGTAQNGGDFGFGNVFRILPDGTFSTVYSFTGGADGSAPTDSLVQAKDGNFYGMTPGGARGFGNIYRLTAQGVLTTIYTFTNGTDGSAPSGALVQGTDGSLYGVTKRNTIAGFTFNGTVFKVTTNGVLTTLYPFNFGEGAIPTAGLMLASDGNFYGTTDSGGANALGTLFRISPGGTYETLVSFDGFNDGSHPGSAVVEGPDGSLYGTTTSGGPGGQGTIFRLRVTSAPRITSQPANTIALVGETISLSVAVAGAPPFNYQWKKDGVNIPEATNRVLTITNAGFGNNGSYSVTVSNSLNSITSGNAQLTVVLQPTFQSVSASNGNVRLSWSAFAGQRYRLQFNSSLGTTNWTNTGSTITATGNSIVTTNVAGAVPQRFYRIQLLR